MTAELRAAVGIAAALGMVATWPNLRTIEAAVKAEARWSGREPEEAAGLILRAVLEDRRRQLITRFYFEDARWRETIAYLEATA